VAQLFECEPPEEMCPGPEECSHFLGAAADSPDEEENERNRDAACEAMGTRCSRRNRIDPSIVGMVSRVERLVHERQARLQPDEAELGPVEREGLVAWYAAEGQLQREQDRQVRELYQIMRARAEAGV
jgi:hypothetical protein